MTRRVLLGLLSLALASCAPTLRASGTTDTRNVQSTCFSALSLLQDLAPTIRPESSTGPYTVTSLTREGLVLDAPRSSSGRISSVATCEQRPDASSAVTLRTTGLSTTAARRTHTLLFERLAELLTPSSP